MSALVFYFPHKQRGWPKKRGGYPRGVMHYLRGRVRFEGASECVVYPRYCGPNGRRLKDVIVFSEETTPPRLIRLPVGRESGSIICENSGHPMMPACYINASGDIVRSCDGAIVMEGDPWNPPVAEPTTHCSPFTG